MPRLSKSKKALLEAFEPKYLALEHNGGYLLYIKDVPGRGCNHKFLGKIYLSTDGKSYVFNDICYPTLDTLIEAIEKYNSTLPFSAEIYNPLYRKNYQVEMAINEYLESLGFKYDHKMNGNVSQYRLRNVFEEVICTLQVEVKDDKTEGKVLRLYSNERWSEASFNGIEEAIAACNSMLIAPCLCINSVLSDMLSKVSNSRAAQMVDVKVNWATLSIESEDAKQKTIKYLERELKRLKEP